MTSFSLNPLQQLTNASCFPFRSPFNQPPAAALHWQQIEHEKTRAHCCITPKQCPRCPKCWHVYRIHLQQFGFVHNNSGTLFHFNNAFWRFLLEHNPPLAQLASLWLDRLLWLHKYANSGIWHWATNHLCNQELKISVLHSRTKTRTASASATATTTFSTSSTKQLRKLPLSRFRSRSALVDDRTF